jgi:hypothetical protein
LIRVVWRLGVGADSIGLVGAFDGWTLVGWWWDVGGWVVVVEYVR